MNLKSLLLLAVLAIAFVSCSDDDNDEKYSSKKELTYDGKKYVFDFAQINPYNLEDGNFDIEFYDEDWDTYFNIELSASWDGKTVDLSKIDNQYDWSYSLELESDDKELLNVFGKYEDDFEEIKRSGSLLIKTIDAEKSIYQIKVNLVVEGKKLTFNYKGEIPHAIYD